MITKLVTIMRLPLFGLAFTGGSSLVLGPLDANLEGPVKGQDFLPKTNVTHNGEPEGVVPMDINISEHKIIHIHLPKTSGLSLIKGTVMASMPICTAGTGFVGPWTRSMPEWEYCECRTSCAQQSQLAIMELPFETCETQAKAPGWENPVFTALIRKPEDWFYSAVAHMCRGHKGDKRSYAPCLPEVNMSVLTENGWWDPTSSVRYYFRDDNLQLQMLGKIREKPNYIICTMENRNALLRMIHEVLPGSDWIDPNNVIDMTAWRGLSNFRKQIKWNKVKQHYAKDISFYWEVAKSGCISSPSMKDLTTRALELV